MQPLPWHGAADAALLVDRFLWLVGPPGCGKTTYATHFAHRHTNLPPFERQGTPNMTEGSFWGHKELSGGATRIVDGPLAAALKAGGVFVLNDVGAVPIQMLSVLLPLRETSIHNPLRQEVLPIPPRFRVILTSNPDNYRCRQGLRIFDSLIDGSLVLRVEEHATEQILKILRAAFPALARGIIERAVANWERFAGGDKSVGRNGESAMRLSIRAAKQYLLLLQHGASEVDAVRLAFIDKFCHDPDTHEAMRMKQSLVGEGDA